MCLVSYKTLPMSLHVYCRYVEGEPPSKQLKLLLEDFFTKVSHLNKDHLKILSGYQMKVSMMVKISILKKLLIQRLDDTILLLQAYNTPPSRFNNVPFVHVTGQN